MKEILGIGDRRYLGTHPIVVTRVYQQFQLVQVRYANEKKTFWIDQNALTITPDATQTISMDLFGLRNKL